MSEYTRQVLKVVVAKICQTIGWHSINSTSMDIMVDLLRRYLIELTRTTHAYSTLFGHTQPNLDELGLAFRDMHINIADLEEYIQYVEAAPSLEVPFYPVPKESHLNFLKPGSNEVVTRPVHIHEHLPPMLPDAEEVDISTVTPKEEPPSSPSVEFGSVVFKRPADIICDTPSKRPRLLIEEEGRPTREISSVMMTTSGFLSPAREGKLPEARTPINAIEPINTINNVETHVPSAPVPPRIDKKLVKSVKENKKTDKRNKDRTSKELFKPDENVVSKKVPNKKPKLELTSKNANMISPIEVIEKPMMKNSVRTSPGGKGKFGKKNDKNMNLPAVTIEKIPMVPEKVIEEKLPSEHDKVKLNIFKKISKVKDDKTDKAEKHKKEEVRNEILTQSRESSPDLIIDESDNKNDKLDKSKFTPDQNNKLHDIVKNSPHSDKDFMYDDYMSPPGTPLTPKTPEMPTHSPPIKTEKRKKKEKTKLKNKTTPKTNNKNNKTLNSESIDLEMERPKTPDPINLLKPELTLAPPPGFPFLPNFNSGPGLIPPLLQNPIFPKLNPLNLKHGFGQPAQISPATFPFVPIKPPDVDIPSRSGLEITPIKDEIEIIPIKEKHKKDKKDKIKKKNKKDKIKNKSEKRKIKEEKKEKDKVKKIKKEKKKDKEREHEGSVPKLTLKISSPRPPTPDAQVTRKIMIKPVVKKENPPVQSTAANNTETRQPSPELARISALITRPPKLKTKEAHGKDDVSHTPKVNGAGRGRPSSINKAATQAVLHDEKPLAGKPPKAAPLPPPPPVVQETEENKIWICPACGRQDDGTPMIGCDDCDAWYHWVCVGIQVPPDDNEDWYCRICIVKKQEMLQVDKKKKRKKKEKKGVE